MNDNHSKKLNIKNLVAYTPSGMHVCRLTPPIHMTYASDGFCRMVGYTREEIKQKFDNIYTKMIHEDDKQIFREHIHRLAEKPTKSTVEYRLISKDGKMIYVSEIQESIYEGDILMGYADVTDISERKSNEFLLMKEKDKYKELYKELKVNNERFRFVSEHSGVMFYELNITKKKYVMTENVYNIFQYTNKEFLDILNNRIEAIDITCGKYTTNIIHNDDIAIFDNATNELMNNNESYCEARICNSNGEYIWCAITRHLIKEDDGSKICVIGCIYDITQKHEEIEYLKSRLKYDPNTGLIYEKPAKMLIEQVLINETNYKHTLLICEVKKIQIEGEKIQNDNFHHLIANILKRLFQDFNNIMCMYMNNRYIIFIKDELPDDVIKQKASELVNVINLETYTGSSMVSSNVNVGIAVSEKDITTKELIKRAEMALRNSKYSGVNGVSFYENGSDKIFDYNELEQLVSTAMGGVIVLMVLSEKIKVLYFSDTVPQMTGQSVEEYKNGIDDAFMNVYDADIDKVKTAVHKCIDEHRECDVVFRKLHKNGSIVWIHASGKIVNKDNNYPIIYSVYNNITNDMNMYNDILDFSDRMILLCDMHTNEILYANKKSAQYAKRLPGSYIGKRCYEWFAHKNAPCSDCHLGALRNCGEFRREWKGENGRVYSIMAKTIDWFNKRVFVEFFSDITEIKQANKVLEKKNIEIQEEHDIIKKKYNDALNDLKIVENDYISLMRIDVTDEKLEDFVDRGELCNNFFVGMDLEQISNALNNRLNDNWDLRKYINKEYLYQKYKKGEKKFEFEISYRTKNGRLMRVQAQINLLKNPDNMHLILFVKEKDISYNKVIDDVFKHIVQDSYEFIGYVDVETGLCSVYSYNDKKLEYNQNINSYIEFFSEQDNALLYNKTNIESIVNALDEKDVYDVYFTIEEKGKKKNKRISYFYLNSQRKTIVFYKQDITNVVENREKWNKLHQELEFSKINALMCQMQPHFLYNALNTINALITVDQSMAQKAVVDFSTHLRATIKSLTINTLIKFEDEINNVEAYLNIERLRFGKLLNIEYDLREMNFKIVPMVVQPFAENAIKHGILPKLEKGGTLIIRSYTKGEYIIVEVEDDGVGFDVSKIESKGNTSSVGIRNTMYRLKQIMGAKIKIESEIEKGTKVTIKIKK